jgi:hypothetical protein
LLCNASRTERQNVTKEDGGDGRKRELLKSSISMLCGRIVATTNPCSLLCLMVMVRTTATCSSIQACKHAWLSALAFFLDIKTACDTVPHDPRKYELRRNGVQERCLRVVQTMCARACSRIAYNGVSISRNPSDEELLKDAHAVTSLIRGIH